MVAQCTCCFPRTLVQKLKVITFCPSFKFRDAICSLVGMLVRINCFLGVSILLLDGASVFTTGLSDGGSEGMDRSSLKGLLLLCSRVLTRVNGIDQNLHPREEEQLPRKLGVEISSCQQEQHPKCREFQTKCNHPKNNYSSLFRCQIFFLASYDKILVLDN